jgi:hypothetical protein
MGNKKLILAGNHDQFQNFIREMDLDRKDCIYGNTWQAIAGLRINREDLHIVGTFWDDVAYPDELYQCALGALR